MSKINIQKYESWLKFLEGSLYIKRDQLNALFSEAGEQSIYHNFGFQLQDISEHQPQPELSAAHQIEVSLRVSAPVTLYERLRTTEDEMNTLLIQAAVMGLQLDLAQHVIWMDEIPENPEENYSGRFALLLDITAPNIITQE